MPRSDSSRPDLPTTVFAGALVACLHPLRFGYQYGSGDHDDLLPPVLAQLHPEWFSHDAYVQSQVGDMTVRTVFQMVLRALSGVLSLPAAAGVLHLLSSVAVGAGVFALARALRLGRTASVLATALACVVVPTVTIGGNAVIYSLLTPEGIAWAVILPAMAWFVQKKRMRAAALLGFAAWFHLLAAGLVGLVLTGVALLEALDRREGWGRAAAFGGLAAAIAAPIAVPVLLRQSAEAGAALPRGLDAFTLYATLRFPHHFLPTHAGIVRWGLVLVLGALGIAGYLAARRSTRPPDIRFPLRFAIAAIALMVIGTVGIYAFESLAAARVQAFKLTVLLNVLACIGLSGGLLSRLSPDLRQRADRALRRQPRAVWSLAVGLLLLGSFARWTPDPDPARSVAEWAHANTDRHAVFAVPPSMAGFRVPSERSVVVTWKSVPFRADLAADWWTRLMAVAPLADVPRDGDGLQARLDSAYVAQPDDARRQLAESYGATHAVVPSTVSTALPVLHDDGTWKVLRLSE